MYDNKRSECYAKFKNLMQDKDISECFLLINKIKVYRHNKITAKQTDTFDRLFKNTVDTIITSVLELLADTCFWWMAPQYQCTGKQWYQKCNYYTHSTYNNSHNIHQNGSSMHSTIYQQQVCHQPIHHPLNQHRKPF